jgi:hypothetical protein
MNENKAYSTQCIYLTFNNICVWVNMLEIGKKGFLCFKFGTTLLAQLAMLLK